MRSTPCLRAILLCLCLSGVMSLIACTDDNGSPTPGGVTPMPGQNNKNPGKTPPEGAVTYHRDVRPLFDRHCMDCHGEQARGEFSMAYDEEDWAFKAPEWVSRAIDHVRGDGASHWQRHDTSCGTSLEHPGELGEDDILTLARWESDGKWEGDPGDYEPGSVLFDRPDGDPDITFTIPEYLPASDSTIDHRCYVLEDALTEDIFIGVVELVPGNELLVDHITLVTANIPEESSALLTVDRDNQEPGFECFGQFQDAQQPKMLHSWSPGSPQGIALPEGQAFVLPKGARLAIQVHYNTTRVEKGELRNQPADASMARLWKTSQPDTEVRVIPFANIRLEIPAGAEAHEDTYEFEMPYDADLLGLTPHVLDFGTGYQIEVLSMDAGASTNPQCLLDLPDWTFSTKQSYQFANAVPIKAGDRLRQTCQFANTPERQPTIRGQKQDPEIVFWGTTPGKEMCLSQVLVGVPYDETNKVDCSPVEDCIKQCPPNDLKCFGVCASESSGDCTRCAFTELINCGGSKCGDVGLDLAQCLRVCDLNSGYGLFCIEQNCAFEWQEFSNCGIEKFSDGTCVLDMCR